MATAMWAVIGILGALQERRRTGRGGIVDTSLYETTLAWMTLPMSAYLADGEIPARHGSGIAQIVPYQAFAAADGHIMVAAGNDNLFRRLCGAVGRPGLAEDPRFRTNADRVVNRGALIAILADLFAAEPVTAWAGRLDAAGIPNGPIQTIDKVAADPQTAALGMIQRWIGGGEGSPLALVGLPLSFDGARPSLDKLAPRLGEDNSEIVDLAG
jgi:crotonobetainyl-CoA:carnitine CoA-transferase CaiB-like acyl-CoA transferase